MSEYWIQTYSGKRFDLLEPTEEMICIEDIAHHLSIENRFSGATKFPYSVAYHSILVCQHSPRDLELEGLLHDAAEAYCKDLTTPLRNAIYASLGEVGSFSKYEKVIDRVQAIINRKYKIEEYSLVKDVDLRMAKTERNLLMTDPPAKWNHRLESVEEYSDIEILNLTASNVEQLFLKEFEKWRRN